MKVINRKKHGTPGCARCRMDEIRFTKETKTPRFTLQADEVWYLPQTSHRPGGMIALGDGIVPPGSFEVVKRDAERASHNGRPCPGLKLDVEAYPDAMPELIGARS